MEEVKTLKDFETEVTCTPEGEDFFDYSKKELVKFVNVHSLVLRQEAIKWVNKLKNGKIEDGEQQAGAIQFIYYFFNLTDEDFHNTKNKDVKK